MAKKPPQWSTDQLAYDAAFSIARFRNERLEVSGAWTTHYEAARTKFEALFETLRDLRSTDVTDESLIDSASVYWSVLLGFDGERNINPCLYGSRTHFADASEQIDASQGRKPRACYSPDSPSLCQ